MEANSNRKNKKEGKKKKRKNKAKCNKDNAWRCSVNTSIPIRKVNKKTEHSKPTQMLIEPPYQIQ
jgi:hypothetical protein